MPFSHVHAAALRAAPGRVFRALTEPDALRRWFAEDVQVEPRQGGVFRFWGRHTPGTPAQEDARQVVTRFEPDRLLAILWPILEVDTDVTFALEPDGQGSRLTVTHDVSGELPRSLVTDFWRAAIANLATHLSGGSPELPDYFKLGRDSSGSS